jgi:radical SAM superfamily enzyme YgiQ (UPF0313 family)
MSAKVQLICEKDSVFVEHNFPEKFIPTSLFILANYITQQQPDTVIEIHDGHYTNLANNIDLFDGDIIGFTDWFSNHEESIKLLKAIKKKNPHATIVFGGPNATNLGKMLLINHKEIDYVVLGDGEEALLKLVSGKAPESIPNLVFRYQGQIKQNGIWFTDLNLCPALKLGGYHISVEKYLSGYILFPISFVRGCVKSKKSGQCLYCSLPYNSQLRIMSPPSAWQQLIDLNSRYGIQNFFETSDNFIISEDFLTKFLRAKPEGAEHYVKLRINTDIPSLLSLRQFSLLREIGIVSIFVGIETIDQKLQRTNRNITYSKDDVTVVFQRLKDAGIKVFPSFLFGLMGEDENSMKENEEFIVYLVNSFSNIEDILVDHVLPLRGSAIFGHLAGNKRLNQEYRELTGKRLLSDDSVDYKSLTKLYLQHYTKVSENSIIEILRSIDSIFHRKRISRFGGLA